MNFRLEERPPGWIDGAPILIHHELQLPASPDRVFDVLADSPRWTNWFTGMRRVRIDGPATGVGMRRTVWVGPNRVQERFTVWEPGRQITLHIVGSNTPGLRVMAEDYRIAPETTPAGTASRLSITIGVEAKGPFRLVPGLVRLIVGRATSGVLGITTVFAAPAGPADTNLA